MDATRLKQYRTYIKQTPETMAYVLGTDTETYLRLESGEVEIPNRVVIAFDNLFTRFPGSESFAVPTIKAIIKFKESYYNKHGRLPIGIHKIDAPWKSIPFKDIDFTPFDKYTLRTEQEMMEWINTHDISTVITPEYFNHLTTKTDAELEEEVDFWDGVYTAQHYGKYKSRATPKELEGQIRKKREQIRTYWINRVHSVLIKLLAGLIILWAIAYLIIWIDRYKP